MLGTPESYAYKLYNRKTQKRGLGPLVAVDPRMVRHHLGRSWGWPPKEEEGEEKGRVMVLVKVIELDFEGAMKRKVIEMMMMIMLEVEILVMGVVLWW